MKIHVLRHVPYIYYGHIESWVKSWGATLVESRLYQGGELRKEVDSDLMIIMGGPMSVWDEKTHTWLKDEKKLIERSLNAGKKILGICLGAQLIAHVLGAKVSVAQKKEIGWHKITKTTDAKNLNLLNQVPDQFISFQWHGDTFELPANSLQLFTNENNPEQGFFYNQQAIGVQFHPEMEEKSIENMIWRSGHELTSKNDSIHTAEEIRAGYQHSSSNKEIMHALIEALIK